MEDCSENKRKRARNDSELDSPESKATRFDSDPDVDSSDSGSNSPESKLARVDPEESQLTQVNCVEPQQVGPELEKLLIGFSETKQIEDDLLNILDDSDNVTDPDPVIQGLDSFIKSFEEEILAPTAPITESESNSGGSQPGLGYLLEASDDELGLPPAVTSTNEERKKVEAIDWVGFEHPETNGFGGELFGFEDEMASYDSLEFGVDTESDGCNNDEFVTLGGLFDFTEPGVSLWPHESLQA
ncbi:Carbohydrate-responsive element-binding protein [Quillaja saponaria]|uniref:Carbohydrate-responsive element-binding protein n=1 Tax=Quillaja saponaria TaxID=32244 RepID=A0AAD7M5I1_QUISA|nr:Carbohydrate-responsive element-binding protein [Quillaja saponaria]